jgi:hypothetical protein
MKEIKRKLINYFQDVNKGTDATNFLLSHKEKVESFALSRTVFKKKKKSEVNLN